MDVKSLESSESTAKPERRKRAKTASPKPAAKKQQLLDLIARPGGVRIGTLTEKLGWQKHTVRAALSGLRKEGHVVLASKVPKTGETLYRLMNAGSVETPAGDGA